MNQDRGIFIPQGRITSTKVKKLQRALVTCIQAGLVKQNSKRCWNLSLPIVQR